MKKLLLALGGVMMISSPANAITWNEFWEPFQTETHVHVRGPRWSSSPPPRSPPVAIIIVTIIMDVVTVIVTDIAPAIMVVTIMIIITTKDIILRSLSVNCEKESILGMDDV